jgi:aryl-alcohol dehydrogenase-like predicted oxidoreductase
MGNIIVDLPVKPLTPQPFGLTGISCSPLGIGTVKWGRTEGLKHTPFELPDDATLHRLLDDAAAAGINVLDTAPSYGLSEARIGQLLADRKHDFLIFTKAGESFENGRPRWDFRASSIRHSVENSLRLLRTDRLAGVTLHCPLDDLGVITSSEAPATLAALRAEGKIGLAGFSVMSTNGGLRAVPLFDHLMVAWNTGFHEHEPVIHAAANAGRGILLKKVLSSGHLHGTSPTGALNAARTLPGHPVSLVGTLSPAHLAENIRALTSPSPA